MNASKYLHANDIQPLIACCSVTWAVPTTLEPVSDHDDIEEDGISQFVDNLFIAVTFEDAPQLNFTTSRRFTVTHDHENDMVSADSSEEWPWDAHDELEVAQKQLLEAMNYHAPEKLEHPADLLGQLLNAIKQSA